jgi:choice-of-anchor C domain-containing protein
MSGNHGRALPYLLALALSTCAAWPSQANLLVNGSFETGPDPGDALQLAAGSTAISGWVVTRTNIDYVGARWTAAQGARSLGLNGATPGGIAQTFASLPHGQYTVRCYMAGDPFTTPDIKTMRVVAAADSVDFQADITDMWPWDPGWNPHVWSFLATSTSTTIEFFSLDSGDAGPALDSVSVELTSTAGVDPASAALELSAPFPNPARRGWISRCRAISARALPSSIWRAARSRCSPRAASPPDATTPRGTGAPRDAAPHRASTWSSCAPAAGAWCGA